MVIAPMILAAAIAARPPVLVVVGPEKGPGSVSRANLEAALEEREDVLVVGLPDWSAAAARAKVRGRAVSSAEGVPRIAPAAGVTAAVVLSPPAARGDRRISALLVTASGRRLWSRTFPLSGPGALGRPGAAALAEEIARLVQPPPAPPPPPPPPGRQTAPAPREPVEPAPLPVRPPRATPPPTGPRLRVAVGATLAWRSASVAPASAGGFSYHGGSPYPGFTVAVAVAPLRAVGVRGWLEPLELAVEGSRRFASVALAGSSGPSLAARELRLSVDAAYPLRLGASTELAPRVGYGWHRFTIDRNAVMPESLRHGARLGLDVRQRLLRALSVEASGRIFPAMRPGPAEREAFGADASGWGYQVGGALEGPLVGGLGWRAAYDYLHFADSFSGPGAAGTGGSGAASYHTATAAATFTW